MSVVFQDTFTDSNGTLLTAHTPDTGTSWTVLTNDSGEDGEINTNRTQSTGNQNNAKLVYEANGSYGGADYTVEIDAINLTTDINVILARVQDANNAYGIRFSQSLFHLYKIVGGSASQLDTSGTLPVDTDTIKLEVIGTAIKGYINNVEQLSAVDSDISAAGQAGLGWGGFFVSTDDVDGSVTMDNFVVTLVGGRTTKNTRQTMQVQPAVKFMVARRPRVTF